MGIPRPPEGLYVTTTPHKKTGCQILDSHGVTVGDPHDVGREICFNCPLDECVLDRNKLDEDEEEEIGEEIEVICKNCGTMETLVLIDGKLGNHPRFTETHHLTNNRVCGIIRKLG